MTDKTKFQTGVVKLINRNQIKNAPYNPRKISNSNKARLRDGIKTHGMIGPLAWNERTGNLVGGHQRLEQIDALESKRNGDFMIEVTAIDVDEVKEKALNVLLNNPSTQGEWDLSLLGGVIEDIRVGGLEFEETGFSERDISILFPGSFMTADEQAQDEAEFPITAVFDDIKRSSAEHDAKFRADAKSQPFATIPDVENMDDGEGKLTPEGNPTHAEIDPDTGEKKWTKEQREEFKGVRKNHWKSTDEEIAGDVIISLSFQNPEQLAKFDKHFGLDGNRYPNVPIIERAFNIDLRGSE